jgi:plastocyanin
MQRFRPIIRVGLMVGLLAAGCSSDGGPGGDAGANVELTAPAGAATDGFEPTTLQVDADAPFTITFVNDDEGVPHNVQIFQGSATGEPVWAPADDAVITGPDQVTYEIPGLSTGEYLFNCLTHPTTMVGTLTSG